jgi:hypothetical protein
LASGGFGGTDGNSTDGGEVRPDPPAKPGFGLPKKDFRSATQTSTQHGRIETRALTTSSLLTG